MTFFEIGGVFGSFLAGYVTDIWMQKVGLNIIGILGYIC